MNRREFNRRAAAAAGLTLVSSATAGTRPNLRVNGPRLQEHLRRLSEFGKNPQGGVTRLAYSEQDRQARDYIVGLMQAANLQTHIDAAGNIVGKVLGSRPELPVLLTGSHIDTVPEGGNFDGCVGSISAIEAVQTLSEKSLKLRRNLEVVIFQNEEEGLFGSRALSGDIGDRDLALTSRSGKTIREGITFIGGDPSKLASVRRKRGEVAAYLEYHIEQGPLLDSSKTEIGIVDGIVGVNRWDVTVQGFANHAGTTPMNRRRDALLSAARFIEMTNRVVTGIDGSQVGTVGRINAFPGATNVVPGRVTLSLELRDLDPGKLLKMYQRIQTEARRIGRMNGTSFAFNEVSKQIPAPTSPLIQQAIASTAKKLGYTTRVVRSGAGHDAQAIARFAPIGMIFIPSVGGISHSPQEYSRVSDIVKGANVYLNTLLKLDASG